MPSNKQISEIIDEQAVERQFTMLLEWLNKAKATIETMPKLFDNYKNSGGGAEATKALQGMSTGMEAAQKNTTELTLSVKEYQKTLQQLAQTQAKQNVMSSDIAQTLAAEKEALRQRNQEVKNAAIVNQAAEGSIKQMRAALNQLQMAYDSMSASERKSASGNELQMKIKAQSDALMKLEADTGRYSRNVGNYTGAVKILESALQEVTEKINQMTQSGSGNSESINRLKKEQELLSQALLKNEQGFASLTMEVKSNKKALATMFAEGLGGTKAFQQLQQQIAGAERELREFNDTQKLFSAELPAVAAASVAAKGLAGGYALAAGASALFAEGNEKVEKELNKLVAIMTIMQGLNEVNELIEKRLAIAKIFSAAGTGVQTAAIRVYTFVTDAATVATKAFRAVLVTTGILGVVAALAGLVSMLKDAKEATDKAANATLNYDKALENTKMTLKDNIGAVQQRAKISVESVKQKAGSEAEIYKITQQSLHDQVQAYIDANNEIDKQQDQLQKDRTKLLKKGGKEALEQVKKLNDQEQKLMTERVANYDNAAKLTLEMQYNDAKEKTRLSDLARKSEKAYAESGVVDLEKQQIALKTVMSNEKETYEKRIKATAQFYELQRQISERNKNIALLTPNLTSGEIAKIKADNSKALAGIASAEAEEKRRLFEQEKQRTLNARLEIYKAELEQKMAFEQNMYNNEEKSLQERLSAYDEYSKNSKKSVDAEWQYKRSQQGLLQSEIEALDKDHQSKLAAIELNGAIERKHIIESALNNQLKDQKMNINFGSNDAQMLSIARLNELFKKGKINIEDYDKQLKKLEETAADNSLKFQANALEESIKKRKEVGLQSKDLEMQLSELKMQMLKNESDKEKETQAERVSERKKAIDTIMSYETMAADLVKGLVDSGYEQQLNNIQEQIDLNTKQKDIEIANAQASTMSAQDKAATIAIINAKAQAEQDRLQLEQKKVRIKQAQFDKEMAAFQVVVNTAATIMKTGAELGYPAAIPFVIAAGIEGAVQLATILAKPIPKYALGTDNHPGGPAVVGDAGVELVKTPSGKSFLTPNAPTLMDLPTGTKVIKHDEVNKMMLNEMMHRQAVSLIGSPDVVRELKTMREMQVWQTDKLVKAMGNKPITKVVVINNADFNAHIKQQIFD